MNNLDALNEAFTGGTRWAITGETENGVEVGGVILSAEVQQVRDFDTQEPQFWQDGNPMNEVVIEVQTDERDGENDRGVRAHHVKTWGDQAKELKRALREAGATSPADGLKPGNEFYGQRVRKEPVEGKKYKKNVFAFRIVKNAGAGLNAVLDDSDAAAEAAGYTEAVDPAPAARKVQGGKPVQKAAPAPDPVDEAEDLDDETRRKVKVMLENDFDHGLIASTLGIDVADVEALAG